MKGQNWIFLLAGIGVLLFFTGSCEAAKEAASGGGYLAGYENADPRPTATSWWGTLAYLISIFAVFIFVVASAYFVTRLIGGRFAQNGGMGGRVLQNLPLGANRAVCVVELADRVLLLGVTEHNITLLGEIDDPEQIERLHQQSLMPGMEGDIFSKQFGALSGFVQKIPPLFQQNKSRK